MGDLNRRRANILAVESGASHVVLKSHVPLGDLWGYANAIRSLSRGRASYSMTPSHVERVPDAMALKIASDFGANPAKRTNLQSMACCQTGHALRSLVGANSGGSIVQIGFLFVAYCSFLQAVAYIVELDNYGRSNHPGQPNAQGGNFLWIWGYDEITWFGLQSQEYRAKWLQYAWGWVRTTDTNGYLEMPGGRTASSAEMRWYFANNPSDACPTGRGDEWAIRVVWANDIAKPSK